MYIHSSFIRTHVLCIVYTGTRVSTSFDCVRAAVLEEHIGGSSNAKAVEGTLLHELFQVCVLGVGCMGVAVGNTPPL